MVSSNLKIEELSGAAISIIYIVFMILLGGCSDSLDKPTLPGAHPVSWMDESSFDFHGSVSLKSGTAGCTECHGEDFDGGKVGVSCIACHAQLTDLCIACHGGRDNHSGAPPLGLRGEVEDTALAVGAHTIHLEGDLISSGYDCSICHHVPFFILDNLHLDFSNGGPAQAVDSVAEVIWHGFADGGGAVWNRTSRKCLNTYCHGNFDGGTTSNAPIWTASGQAECGSCHDIGSNPAELGWKHEFHISSAGLACDDCHASVVDEFSDIIGRNLHVNGVVDTLIGDTLVCNTCHGSGEEACTFCHGGLDNMTGAPPEGLRGEITTSLLAVGAHTSHVEGGDLANSVDCSECHLVPLSTFSSNHLGLDSIAEITWGSLAGTESNWTRSTASCSGTYCHGNFPGGMATNVPVWTGSDQALCGSCHDIGENPEQLLWKHSFHITEAGLECADCHAGVVDLSMNIIGKDQHINGIADTLIRDQEICNTCHGASAEACTYCHGGTDNQSGAPPQGLRGEVSTGLIAVGAHTSHMEEGPLADAFDCSECHKVPVELLAPGHLGADSLAEMTWGSLAGLQSTWNRSTARCSEVYCHGNFSGGYPANSPVWTGTGQADCGSCHDVSGTLESLSGRHKKHVIDKGLDCTQCHSTTVNDQLDIIGKALHVDGTKTVALEGPGFYSNGTCSGLGAGCHGAENWFDN